MVGEAAMPIYEFQCEQCGARFEELVAAGTERNACTECGSEDTRRVISSSISPPGRMPRGAAVRDSESRRREREAARGERLAETRKLRNE
jgi:putative FmdB family regulatory protein